VIAIWMLLQLYVGSRLIGFGASPLFFPAWAAMALMMVAPVGAMMAGRVQRLPVPALLSWAGFIAMGAGSMMLVFVLVADLLHLRSLLGVPVFAAGIVGLTAVLLAFGAWRAARPSVVSVSVPIANLHADLEGFRIVQLSDLHVGHTLGQAFVERVVDTANGLSPDLVALTGDVADGFVAGLRDEVSPLGRLSAPHGKFFVTGNHEYYWDGPGWVTEMRRLGFDALVNSHTIIERGDSRLLVAGITDHTAGGMAGHRSDAKASIAGAARSDVKLLLAHQPSAAYLSHVEGFDLQLSGHTHGGQYFPFNLLVRLFQPFVAGLHRLETMWIYVSRGTGYWGPPFRLGAPSEITLIQLVRA
jgi:predicted MPP superfamily phosphohydrolase